MHKGTGNNIGGANGINNRTSDHSTIERVGCRITFGICKGPGGGIQGRLACAHKCGFRYQHTEKDKPCPLMGDVRTEHFYYLTKEEWQKEKERGCEKMR